MNTKWKWRFFNSLRKNLTTFFLTTLTLTTFFLTTLALTTLALTTKYLTTLALTTKYLTTLFLTTFSLTTLALTTFFLTTFDLTTLALTTYFLTTKILDNNFLWQLLIWHKSLLQKILWQNCLWHKCGTAYFSEPNSLAITFLGNVSSFLQNCVFVYLLLFCNTEQRYQMKQSKMVTLVYGSLQKRQNSPETPVVELAFFVLFSSGFSI